MTWYSSFPGDSSPRKLTTTPYQPSSRCITKSPLLSVAFIIPSVPRLYARLSRQAWSRQYQAVGLGGVVLAQGEAFAVEDGVPAEAAAHAVHFAVEIPAAVRAGIEQFILPAVGFQVRRADSGQPHGHAPPEQFCE